MPVQFQLNKGKVPVKIYTDEVDSRSLDQLGNMAQLPFIHSHIAAMPDDFEHEPALGLEAGDDGLVIAKRILQQAHLFLSPGGWLVVEVGRSAEALIAAVPDLPLQWLEFEQGGDGVFCLQREDLAGYLPRCV